MHSGFVTDHHLDIHQGWGRGHLLAIRWRGRVERLQGDALDRQDGQVKADEDRIS
jgi:hypothetical protein